MKITEHHTPDLMGKLDEKSKKSKKSKSADTIADELESEAKRLLYWSMILRGKDKLQLRVKK